MQVTFKNAEMQELTIATYGPGLVSINIDGKSYEEDGFVMDREAIKTLATALDFALITSMQG